MKISKILLCVAVLASFSSGFDVAKNKAKNAKGFKLDAVEWKLPEAMNEDGTIDESKMGDSPFEKSVILGNKILNFTSKYIGPEAKDSKKRFAKNHLSCSSCHAKAGTIANEVGFVGIAARFPQYNSRADKIITLQDRINGCMQRSMNGDVMPFNSPEMTAMVAYMTWLSTNTPVGANTKGQSLPNIEFLDRAADPKKGKEIYKTRCAYCHGENGEGLKSESADMDYYIYPAIWGEDSYNTGAGMYRLLKAAAYIKTNMPQDKSYALKLDEAYDVAAFINSKPRPIKKDREADFPDRDVKPADMDVLPYATHDKASVEQHRFGPFKSLYINAK
ncbi:c-type cytochrome [Campylobacter hominis]|uniref:c-type cytochrome n=1 Tax=Campylobacter hominis TaxID=76517 RepID=UPI0023F11F22|nr:c-type cytochrome [Campylobacter hominis]MDD7422097.1 c-type cytochrome [Campylobacter hominis]MDY3117732.1 c-type cytochrome [Campylobacter hominis]